MKLLLPLLAAAIVTGAATDASATHIKSITFAGHGVVTFAIPPPGGWPSGPPVVVGTPVSVSGMVWFGNGQGRGAPPPVPVDFTGVAPLTPDALHYRSQRFAFSVDGGATGWDTFRQTYLSWGSVTFANGVPTTFALGNNDDPTISRLSPTGFETATGYDYDDAASWGGSWAIDTMSVSGGVPEPAAWALMILGFGGLGAAMRRRRGQARALRA
jgi:hypothetical protein